MTALHEPLTRPVKKAPAASDTAASVLGTLAGAAIASWLGGIALSKGFGISVPFLAAWLLIIAFLFFVKQAAGAASSGWHGE